MDQQEASSHRIEPPDADADADELNNQGCSHAGLGQLDLARACFEQAWAKDPTHPQASYNLGLLQWRAGEITDQELLRRLANCTGNTSVDPEVVAELSAQVHAERFDEAEARAALPMRRDLRTR